LKAGRSSASAFDPAIAFGETLCVRVGERQAGRALASCCRSIVLTVSATADLTQSADRLQNIRNFLRNGARMDRILAILVALAVAAASAAAAITVTPTHVELIYQPSTIPIDVADLPVGYSLGTATFDIVAPYKAGYSLEVGSAYSVYAYGTLLLPDGGPVALLTGIARPASGPGRQVAVFTNAAGKFGAEGLAPGRWTIEMATAPRPTDYVIDIPQGTDGLFRCGTLRPS